MTEALEVLILLVWLLVCWRWLGQDRQHRPEISPEEMVGSSDYLVGFESGRQSALAGCPPPQMTPQMWGVPHWVGFYDGFFETREEGVSRNGR